MRFAVGALALACALTLAAAPAPAQQSNQAATEQPTLSSVLNSQLTIVEREFVEAADAMPEDKYSFAPTNGEFKGVRTFAEQVKHVAAFNYVAYETLLGEKPSGPLESLGPADIKTKAQIMKYLRDSFALGHRALATITIENEITPLDHPMNRMLTTRLALADFGLWHTADTYGQVVEYLRMNGIVPPASRPRPKTQSRAQ